MEKDKRLNEVIRIQKKKNNFAMIDRGFLENENLSWKAKGILAYLLSKPDKWKVIIRDLLNHATDGKGSVYKGLNELKELGYYEKIPVRDEKGVFIRWDSVVFEVPDAESLENMGIYPLSKNPEVDNPDMENPFMENRERSNNYLSNNDFNNNECESESAPTEHKKTCGEFLKVRLTSSQQTDLVRSFGETKAIDYINRLDLHMASTGKNYSDHYATIKKWMHEDNKPAQSQSKPNRFINFKQRKLDYDEIERLEQQYLADGGGVE